MPFGKMMLVYEAAIIYLAAGAPFAVMNMLKNRKSPKAALWFNTLCVLVLWLPVISLAGLKRLTRVSKNSAFVDYVRLDADIGRRIREIARLFDERHIGPFDRAKKDDVLEPLERYAALSLAMGRERVVSSNDKMEFFRIADHKDEEVAARCLARRNARRLGEHRDRAVNDIVRTLDRLSHGPNLEKITSEVMDIADMLGDDAFRKEIAILGGMVIRNGSKHDSVRAKIAA